MPLRKLKAPAPVWKVAERVTNGAKCKICGKVYSFGGGTTSNIMNHMKLKHKSNEQVRKMIEELKEKKSAAEKKKALEENRKFKQPLISNWSNRRGKIDPVKEKKIGPSPNKNDSLYEATILGCRKPSF